MRARVVYESMFGNTAKIAEAIAQGLREHAEVEVVNVMAAGEVPAPTVDLLVVGGPTHALGLSRQLTRRDAAKLTDAPIATDIGVREWLGAAMPVAAGHRALAFGTKVAKPPWLPGSAAKGIGKRLRRLGYSLADQPTDFFVEGTTGPLAEGELDRARHWASRVAFTELDRITHRV
ncbi:flavodoxin domain-containing protein [Nocardia amikacinitolerans]|uniref:flavodoxin domain-containing protein n=1 Tax=Nocardia amikacinitolerans TaxID=756689 RepID=UPI0026467D94|nr:flavodoxin domain-containing protein [Nocardia amikacinitolerans]MCP2293557.1 Protoporphyrinogen IX oxidase, menaquinone-dependent (flavodoxin domain) [Nocardia amikacinitolerans]